MVLQEFIFFLASLFANAVKLSAPGDDRVDGPVDRCSNLRAVRSGQVDGRDFGKMAE
jgi:hypothetical protein